MTKWKKLWENNKALIKDPNKIYAGFYLYYQATEEEKQNAEKHRGEAPAQQLGTTEQPAAPGEAAATAAPAEQAPVTPTTQNADTTTDNGGLQSLINPEGGERAPAGQN